ncbi:hypothetical protein WT25_02610 [Burkholderia territorii]|uniref:hypothetical protein n=1 Tax=Burkholderia territorii TaxID=1503055 RepID=UPI00075496EB|nr:hypothetical protein [Burkholderia territorii]KVT75796.1 hypothetical protein WT25_02610 [Burkholderia territorii]
MKKLLEFVSSQKMQRASIAYIALTMPVVTLIAMIHIVQQQAVMAEAAVHMARVDASMAVRLLEASGRAKLLIGSLLAATNASVVAYLGSTKRNQRV